MNTQMDNDSILVLPARDPIRVSVSDGGWITISSQTYGGEGMEISFMPSDADAIISAIRMAKKRSLDIGK